MNPLPPSLFLSLSLSLSLSRVCVGVVPNLSLIVCASWNHLSSLYMFCNQCFLLSDRCYFSEFVSCVRTHLSSPLCGLSAVLPPTHPDTLPWISQHAIIGRCALVPGLDSV
jgi:hypothetical protein